jgi:hypothetical protein
MYKNSKLFVLFIFFFLANLTAGVQENLVKKYPFNKVIIWGHKLHSHSHSYIHAGFFKAFKHLGYDTYWLDNNDDVTCMDFSNSLFITEEHVDHNIPLRVDCRYILHNCSMEKYIKLFEMGNCIIMQVYDNGVMQKADKLDDCIFWNQQEKVLYMPWATDLLPYEIDQVKQNIQNISKQSVAYYIGYVNDGAQGGNKNKIMPFSRACAENNIRFRYFEGYLAHPVSMEESMQLIQTSIVAPAIQGQWQCDAGYIPCRIFKNISYGQLGITNSKTVYDLFKGKIVYNPDTYQLFYDAKKRMETLTREELFEVMDFVKEKHTYINRIEVLLECLNKIKPLKTN